MPSADDILLNRSGVYPEKLSGPEEENTAARVLRREQLLSRRPVTEKTQEPSNTFNQARLKALINKEKDKNNIDKKDVEIKINPISAKTARILRNSWIMASSGIGLVWTFIYVNIHWFMSIVTRGKFFCSLGEEWGIVKSGGIPELEILKHGKKAAGISEKALIIFLDAIIAVIILTLIIFAFVINNAGQVIVEAGWEAITNWFKSTFGG